MALKLSLKPHEKLIIGGAVVTNGGDRCSLIIENSVPLLREKEILRLEDADTPCKKIYFTVQLMYVDEQNLSKHHANYWGLVKDVINAAPGTLGIVDRMSEQILAGAYYQALKTARLLINYEKEALGNVLGAA